MTDMLRFLALGEGNGDLLSRSRRSISGNINMESLLHQHLQCLSQKREECRQVAAQAWKQQQQVVRQHERQRQELAQQLENMRREQFHLQESLRRQRLQLQRREFQVQRQLQQHQQQMAAKCPHNAAKSDDSTIPPAPGYNHTYHPAFGQFASSSAAASAITTIAYASSCSTNARASYYAIRDAHSLSLSHRIRSSFSSDPILQHEINPQQHYIHDQHLQHMLHRLNSDYKRLTSLEKDACVSLCCAHCLAYPIRGAWKRYKVLNWARVCSLTTQPAFLLQLHTAFWTSIRGRLLSRQNIWWRGEESGVRLVNLIFVGCYRAPNLTPRWRFECDIKSFLKAAHLNVKRGGGPLEHPGNACDIAVMRICSTHASRRGAFSARIWPGSRCAHS